MAKQIFKGFKQVAYSDSLTYENGYLYLVRTASGTTADGYLYFNGKKYATSKAATADIEALLGELPSVETTFSAWIQKVASALTIETAAREAMDESLLGDSTGETTEGATIYDVKRKVESISGSTHTHSNKEVLDTISAEKVATWDGTLASANTYTNSQIETLDATVSGASNGVEVEVVEANGVITNVNVTAPDFANTYDAKGAADAAFSAATANTTSQISTAIAAETTRTESTYAKPADIATAIEALDATVSGESNGVQVTVAQSDGVLNGVTVVAPDFGNTYDEKGAAASAETSAKEYADTKIASAITALDATVSGASSGNVTTVEVVEANGVVTAVNVANNLSADSDNALSIKSDGLFAAIYYEDEDTV